MHEDKLLRKKGRFVLYAERTEAFDSGYTSYLIFLNPSVSYDEKRIVNSNGWSM